MGVIVILLNTLFRIRERAGLSQTEFAKEIGISVQRYNAYENGKRRLPVEIALQISNHFNISLDEIYANSNNETLISMNEGA